MIRVTNRKDAGAALVVLVSAAAYLALALTYPTGLGRVPALAAVLVIALALLDFLVHTDTRAGAWIGRMAGQRSDDGEPAPGWRPVAIAMLWPLGYVAAVAAIGFLAATAAYVFLYMWLYGRKPAGTSALAAVIVTAAIWLTFVVAFRYPLFKGVAFGGTL